jgi:hypothetical protein
MDEHVNIVAHIFALEKPTLSTTAGERVFVQEVRRKGLVETRVRGLLLRDLLPLEPNASPLVEDRHDVLLLRQPRFGVPSGVHSRGRHCCSCLPMLQFESTRNSVETRTEGSGPGLVDFYENFLKPDPDEKPGRKERKRKRRGRKEKRGKRRGERKRKRERERKERTNGYSRALSYFSLFIFILC